MLRPASVTGSITSKGKQGVLVRQDVEESYSPHQRSELLTVFAVKLRRNPSRDLVLFTSAQYAEGSEMPLKSSPRDQRTHSD
jgi:hypothetical protein